MSDSRVIFLTGASRGETFVAKGYALGAVDYILKPVDPHALRSKVAVFVELFRKTQQIRRQAGQLAETTAFLNSILEGSTEYAIAAMLAEIARGRGAPGMGAGGRPVDGSGRSL